MPNNEKHLSPEEEHIRQTRLEIGLPLGIAILLMLVAVAFVIFSSIKGYAGNISQAAAISIIFLIIPSLFVVLIAIFIIGLADYGLLRGNRVLPSFAKTAREKVEQIATVIQKYLLSIVASVTAVTDWFTSIKESIRRGVSSKR